MGERRLLWLGWVGGGRYSKHVVYCILWNVTIPPSFPSSLLLLLFILSFLFSLLSPRPTFLLLHFICKKSSCSQQTPIYCTYTYKCIHKSTVCESVYTHTVPTPSGQPLHTHPAIFSCKVCSLTGRSGLNPFSLPVPLS